MIFHLSCKISKPPSFPGAWTPTKKQTNKQTKNKNKNKTKKKQNKTKTNKQTNKNLRRATGPHPLYARFCRYSTMVTKRPVFIFFFFFFFFFCQGCSQKPVRPCSYGLSCTVCWLNYIQAEALNKSFQISLLKLRHKHYSIPGIQDHLFRYDHASINNSWKTTKLLLFLFHTTFSFTIFPLGTTVITWCGYVNCFYELLLGLPWYFLDTGLLSKQTIENWLLAS